MQTNKQTNKQECKQTNANKLKANANKRKQMKTNKYRQMQTNNLQRREPTRPTNLHIGICCQSSRAITRSPSNGPTTLLPMQEPKPGQKWLRGWEGFGQPKTRTGNNFF